MKIHIQNLGAIEQAEIDLKPLTLFVGPNNTGKTWTAYLISGLLSPYGWRQYQSAYTPEKKALSFLALDEAIQQLVDEGNIALDLVEFADGYGEIYINQVANLSRTWLADFLSTSRISFDSLDINISTSLIKKEFLAKVKELPLDKKLSTGQKSEALLNALKEPGEPTLYFYTTGNLTAKLPYRAIKDFVVGAACQVLHRALYADVYTFPVERTTFITFNFAYEEIEKLESNGDHLSQQVPNFRPPIVPVFNFLQFISRTLRNNDLIRREAALSDKLTKKYLQLSRVLEQEILNGNVAFSEPELAAWRELLFQPSQEVALEIPLASSMVKELSPLALYLRYLAEPNELLVIDEPEMNLHPEAQARLMEFLAMLVNAGLHVLFTTHSPYLVDHLVNLMKAASHNDPESVKELFYLKNTEAFIGREKVSVYLFEDGTAKNILDEEGLIHWSTFGEVSDRISQIYFDL